MRPEKSISPDSKPPCLDHVSDNQGLCWTCGQPMGITAEEWAQLLEARDAAKIAKWVGKQL